MTIKRKLNFQDFLIIFILSFLAFSILVSAARITLPTHDESSVTTVTSSSFACEFGLKVSKDNSSAQMDLLRQNQNKILVEKSDGASLNVNTDYSIESKSNFNGVSAAFYVFGLNEGNYVFNQNIQGSNDRYPIKGYLEVTKNGECKFAKVYKIN